MKNTITIYEIDWETDGEEVDLPESVTIDVSDWLIKLDTEEEINEAICAYLSDAYGWLVSGYTRVQRTRPMPPTIY